MKKLANIKMLILDVDGVLTDSSIIYSDDFEIKVFNAKDGLGIKLLIQNGIQVGIITSRASKALRRRAKELHLSFLYENIANKSKVLDKIIEDTQINPEQIAYIGDDLIDIPIMLRVGIKICVKDAAKDVIKIADIKTKNPGGKGAVREVAESILKAKKIWPKIIEKLSK